MKHKQQGFSLIELVIVIVILGLLAATAIPRFLNVTDDAEDATVDGVAGGLATAVSFVRSQWEVDGRRNDVVVMDGHKVALDPRFGYPTGLTNTDATQMTAASCQQVFNDVLQNAPRNVLLSQDARRSRYLVSVEENNVPSSVDLNGNQVADLDTCVYYLTNTVKTNPDSGIADAGITTSSQGVKGVTYVPGTGQISSFVN